ncbi:glycosyltransferase family 2 protein [Marinicella sp. W31]|uniref:glycosyltransferase family 2 protein n=1 Tax=Marinicella sp. W31 TaxID=3023713 RepID=UPI0037580BCD
MSPEPTLGVVIVNYNAGSALTECVESLYQYNTEITSVIVVDNNSSDTSIEQLQQSVQGIQVLQNAANVGYATACNQGAALLDTQYLAFVNPDCVFVQSVMKPLLNEMALITQIGVCGCKVDNMDGSEQEGSRRYLPTLFKVFNTYTRLAQLPLFRGVFKGVNRLHETMPEQAVSVEAVSGAFFIIRASVFKQVEGFDNNYPLHFEDLDLFQRVKNANRDIVFYPQVSVCHHKGLSSTDTQQIRAWKKQGLVRFFRNHRSKPATAIVGLMVRIFP